MKLSSFLFTIAFGAAYAKDVLFSPLPPLSPQVACQPIEKEEIAPVPRPNTAEEFDKFYYYDVVASEVGPAAAGYELVAQATNATVASDSYLYYIDLKSYDCETCVLACNVIPDCQSFNIYFERTPVVEPSAACPNPEARVSIMCGLYAESIVPRQISNFGQARGPVDENGEAFQVVISGSNVYNKKKLPLHGPPAKVSETPTASSVSITKRFTASSSVEHVQTSTAAV